MTAFREAIQDLLQADIPTSFKQFGDELDAEFINLALSETGAASVRRRKLPAPLVVWLIIGMALFRDRAILEVVAHLGVALPNMKQPAGVNRRIAPSAVTQARARLGSMPIELLFISTGEVWACPAADEMQWRGLSLYGVDGTTLRVPDTIENREAFGLPSSRRGQAGYPLVRLVALTGSSASPGKRI